MSDKCHASFFLLSCIRFLSFCMVIRIISYSSAFQCNHFSFVLLFVLVMHGPKYSSVSSSLSVKSSLFLSYLENLVSSFRFKSIAYIYTHRSSSKRQSLERIEYILWIIVIYFNNQPFVQV